VTQTTDSFIDEVTEEVRRDRLYQSFRRYGWIGALAVLVIVGGAAWNEWRKSSERAAMQAAGDAMLAALEGEDQTTQAAALAGLAGAPGSGPVAALLAAGAAEGAGDRAGAIATLTTLAQDQAASPLIRDLAMFKALVLQGDTLAPADRITALSALTAPGAPFRLLAQEQIALAHLQAGARDEAVTTLQAILQDAELSGGLQTRAQQLLTALGVGDGA
jgi:hypothetical protein